MTTDHTQQPANSFEKSSIILEASINESVKKATNDIIDFMLSLDDKKAIYDNLVCEMINELEKHSFMTANLELTARQKECLLGSSSNIVERAYDNYKAKILKDKRDSAHIENLETGIKTVIEESIIAVGEEVNRGAVVPCVVAKCDTSNPEKKKIELHYSGKTRITVPTGGFFVSSNCVNILRDSVNHIKKTPQIEDEHREALSNQD